MLVFYCTAINYHNLSGLQQQKLIFFTYSIAENARSGTRFSPSSSHNTKIKVSSEAELGTALLTSSNGYWKLLVICSCCSRGFGFLILLARSHPQLLTIWPLCRPAHTMSAGFFKVSTGNSVSASRAYNPFNVIVYT